MTYVFILIYWLPTWVEGWLDRKGETKKGKQKDTLWLIAVAALVCALAWWLFDINPLLPAAMMFVWRVTTFDYIVHAFLKRYSKGHKDINIWKFSGKTSKTDRVLSKIDWRVRLTIRGVILIASVAWFLTSHRIA